MREIQTKKEVLDRFAERVEMVKAAVSTKESATCAMSKQGCRYNCWSKALGEEFEALLEETYKQTGLKKKNGKTTALNVEFITAIESLPNGFFGRVGYHYPTSDHNSLAVQPPTPPPKLKY